MAFLSNYLEGLAHHDKARYEKKVDEIGCDPYELKWEDMSDDQKLWPAVTAEDRFDYLVFRTNFTTKEAMKNYKSLDAHNFFTSNLVFPPRTKVLPRDRVLLLGKVRATSNTHSVLSYHSNCFSSFTVIFAVPSFPAPHFTAPEVVAGS